MTDMSTSPNANGQDRLSRDLRNVIDDAEQLLRDASLQAGDSYQDARSRLEAGLIAAKARLDAAQQSAAQRAREAGRATDQYVHAHPWQSIGISACIGAGVGLLIGLLAGRK